MDNASKRGLSTFHLTMLALGTVVGGSFFLGSGVAIRAAGPGVVVSFLLGGVLIYVVLYALSEMTVADPAAGSFRMYAQRSFGPGAGFVTGWVYWTGLIFAMSSESIAASTFIREWFPQISVAVLGVVIIIAVTSLNLLGAKLLSKLESGLAVLKLLAIVGFIVLGLWIIAGFLPNTPAVGFGELRNEPLMPGGITGIAGSMLIVIFTYAGFEVIGLAASEARNPKKTIPRAINFTLISLVGLYVAAVLILLPLYPTQQMAEGQSPIVLALSRWGIMWASSIMNIVMIIAILSTMLAATFGLGRMIRSLAADGHTPSWLKDKHDIPYRGILFSGAAMLGGLGFGLILPQQVYLFLISSGGFALLFSYLIIMASHYKWRKNTPCSPTAGCQLPGYPYSSWFAMIAMVGIIASMPFIPGQAAGLIAGLVLVAAFIGMYVVKKMIGKRKRTSEDKRTIADANLSQWQMEAAEEHDMRDVDTGSER